MILKHLIFATLLVIGYGFRRSLLDSKPFWSDALAIIGICYLIVGLFRLVRQSGFFDLTIFGTKKLWEIITTRNYVVSDAKYVDFIKYKNENQYTKRFSELLITAAILLMASIVLI